MYIYKSLKNIPIEAITKCANSAFSDYILPMNFAPQYLEKYLVSNNISYDISCGAFLDGELIGIMGVALEENNGEKFGFDVITGIVPEHRGKGVFAQMFKQCKDGLLKAHIHKYMLEVIIDNERAVKAYKKQGFNITRNYTLYNGPVSEKCKDLEIKDVPFSQFDETQLHKLYTYEPSFQDRTAALKVYEGDYNVLYKMRENNIAAFCIYRKDKGYIAQMGAGHDACNINELKDILLYLSGKYETIVTGNVDAKHEKVVNMLKDLGLNNFANQYEMALEF